MVCVGYFLLQQQEHMILISALSNTLAATETVTIDSGSGMNIVSWLVLGLIAGFIASKLVNKSGEGIVLDIILGIVGAFVGGFIVRTLGIGGGVSGLNIPSLVVAVLGAVVFLIVLPRASGDGEGRGIEGNPNDETAMTNDAQPALRHSCFEFDSSFWFRHSDLIATQSHERVRRRGRFFCPRCLGGACHNPGRCRLLLRGFPGPEIPSA